MLPNNLFPPLCASLVSLLASPSPSSKGLGVSAQNATVTFPARPLYFRLPGSPGGPTCGNSYCTVSESCCNGGCCPPGSNCMIDGSGCCPKGANCTAPNPSQICLDATAVNCYPWAKAGASQFCCPATLPHCTSESGFGTGCFAASTMMPTVTFPTQWNGWNATQTIASTNQPSTVITIIPTTIYVTKTVVHQSGSALSTTDNSDTVTPDDSAPSSMDDATTTTLYETNTTTLTSRTSIITSETMSVVPPNNAPGEAQPQAVTTMSSVASVNKEPLPTTAYDPLDCSWLYFCTDLATISGTSTRVTYLCSSLPVTSQAITDSGRSTAYTTTTEHTTVTPTPYTTEIPIVSSQANTSASPGTSTSTSTSASASISMTTEYVTITHYHTVTVTQTYPTNSSTPYAGTGFPPLGTGSLLTPIGTGQALALRVPEGVTMVTTAATTVVTTVTVTTTDVVEETETPCNTVTSILPLSTSSILASHSLTEHTSNKHASSNTSELPASRSATMSSLQSPSSSIMSSLNSTTNTTSPLSSSGAETMLSATSTVMAPAMTSNSEIMATGSTAVSSNLASTPTITPHVSLCYDSEHNTNGPCSSSTGYYAGASTVPLGSNALAAQQISFLVMSLVLVMHLALRV